MTEFSKKWNALSKSERRKVKHDMQGKAIDTLSTLMKLRCTPAQLKAAAKLKVSQAIALAKVA